MINIRCTEVADRLRSIHPEIADMKKILSTAAIAGIALTGQAMAQDDPRFYAGVFYGIDQQGDEQIRGENAAGAERRLDLELDSGEVFGAVLGAYAFDGERGRMRFEIEAAHREGDLDRLVLNDVERSVRPGSHISTTTAMINALYDTPLIADRFRLTAGAGLGIANVDHEVRYVIERPVEAGGNIAIAIPTTETTYAWQAILGAEAGLTDRLALTGDVKFIELGDYQVQRFNFSAGSLDSVLDADKSSTSATIGLRYSF